MVEAEPMETRLFIDGAFVEAATGATFESGDPASGETIARIAAADAEDVDRAVSAARRAFDNGPWRRTTAAWNHCHRKPTRQQRRARRKRKDGADGA